MEREFDDSETWSLDCTVTSFIISRLERYQELAINGLARDNRLINEFDMLLEATKLIVKVEGSHLWNEKYKDIVTQGLALFPKVFTNLWW